MLLVIYNTRQVELVVACIHMEIVVDVQLNVKGGNKNELKIMFISN